MICLTVKFSQKTNYSFLKLYLIVLTSCKQISFLLHRNKCGVKQNNFEKTPLPLKNRFQITVVFVMYCSVESYCSVRLP